MTEVTDPPEGGHDRTEPVDIQYEIVRLVECFLDPLEVIGVEVHGGVGHPPLEGAAVAPGRDGLGSDLPEPDVLDRSEQPRAGRPLGASVGPGLVVVAREARAHLAMALVIWVRRCSSSDPLVAVGDFVEGLAPDEGEGLGAQFVAARSPTAASASRTRR